MDRKYDLCIIGGAGHVGLPVGVAFANGGVKTALFDINKISLQQIQGGKFPFKEIGGDEALQSALKSGNLSTVDSPEVIAQSKFVLVVLGTPIDENLSPQFDGILRAIDRYINYFQDDHIIILRSTVYPGTTEKIQNYFREKGKNVQVTFCPERITQGHAIEEIKVLPQIVSAFDEDALKKVSDLFRKITKANIISVKPIEAELAKLFTNAWRYIKFSVANQFFMIAQEHDLDYESIERAMKEDYKRNQDLPSPGLTAGPCLLKDTMQLAAFTNNSFMLGHAAMLVNQGFVNDMIRLLKREYAKELKEKTLGILGMAFKADSDDHRDSLSYKIQKIAHVECKKVLCSDPYIKDPDFVSKDHVLENSDIVILAAPHEEYSHINPKDHPRIKFVDVWNFWKKPRENAQSS
ncbi:nucleotide sugar dehydrogenase [bacterium]|nr:nucleotide sugar dehydrogenase [bacterium]|tara:strand:- start:3061 stop:4284 length:1224 start_codon:yes stop_codon:yes gene_type:complete